MRRLAYLIVLSGVSGPSFAHDGHGHSKVPGWTFDNKRPCLVR